MDIAANFSGTQNSMFAEDDDKDNDEDVWGMPKYQQKNASHQLNGHGVYYRLISGQMEDAGEEDRDLWHV